MLKTNVIKRPYTVVCYFADGHKEKVVVLAESKECAKIKAIHCGGCEKAVRYEITEGADTSIE